MPENEVMSKKRKVGNLPDFDPAKFLNDDEDIAAYLTVVIEENDPSLLAAALGDIARASRVDLLEVNKNGQLIALGKTPPVKGESSAVTGRNPARSGRNHPEAGGRCPRAIGSA